MIEQHNGTHNNSGQQKKVDNIMLEPRNPKGAHPQKHNLQLTE